MPPSDACAPLRRPPASNRASDARPAWLAQNDSTAQLVLHAHYFAARPPVADAAPVNVAREEGVGDTQRDDCREVRCTGALQR